MKTNLIQAYLNDNKTYNSAKAERDFDINKELATRTFIKPLSGHGHLVKNSLFDMPSQIFKDAKYSVDAFRHSVKGEANDHELGYLNDFGMKLGGLAIASYLFTRKQTPLTKVMEFVGLGSFFAAMDIWPKLALQLPAYLIHGVNVRQKYVDNYGRKKMFYQDHQFIPWDLYSDEEINRIGDKMRVPKDMKNRRDYIQEKMRKIALQNNTMWMLTSGFATPIMSALICNALEKPIQNYQKELQIKKANKLMTNFPQEIQKYDFNESTKALEKILDENIGKELTPELSNDIYKALTEGIDFATSTGIKEDLTNILPSLKNYTVDSKIIEVVQNTIIKNFEPLKLPKEISDVIIPDKSVIEAAFKEKGLLKDGIRDFSEHIKVVQSILSDNLDKFINDNPGNPFNKKIEFFRKKLVHSKVHGENSALSKALKGKYSAVLTEDTAKNLKSIMSVLNDLKAKTIVLNKYSYIKYAQAPETVLADNWNEITDNLLKPLGITDKEIKDVRHDRKLVAKLLRNKFEAIVSDDAKYSEVITSIQKELSKLPEARIFEGEKGIGDIVYKDKVTATFNEAAETLRKFGMNSTAESLVGFNEEGTASLKYAHIKFVEDRIMGVKSSFYRLLNTLDVYHRISKVQYIDNVLTSTMPREVKEELVELCKNILISAHASDYAVKFYSRRNPERNAEGTNTDFSNIETDAGKVKNKYLGKRNEADLVELSNDRKFFESAMKLMYDGELHPDTSDIIKNTVFKEDFMNYRRQILKYIGGDQYFARPNHLVNNTVTESGSLLKMMLLGSAPDEMMTKLIKQKYNSSKWLKIFATLGASLFGITILSQFFMGKMPKSAKEKR